MAYRAARALHGAGLVGDERMEQLRRKYGSEDYRRASEVMRGVLVKAVTETAGAAYMPALGAWALEGGALELVWGERDDAASLAGVRAALAGPPAVPANVTVVPGAGHLITGALVEEVRSAVLRHQARPGALR